jgi:hypothetical protein
MAEARVALHDLQDPALREEASLAVPQSWKDFCPAIRAGGRETGWEVLGVDRIVEIVSERTKKNTKNKETEPSVGVSFHKAALALVALALAISRKNRDINVYDKVRICPTLYLIEGFDLSYWEAMSPRARIRLRTLSDQFDASALELLAQGYSVSFGMADRVAHALQAGFAGEFEISRSRVLGKPMAGRKPNYRERLFCDGD